MRFDFFDLRFKVRDPRRKAVVTRTRALNWGEFEAAVKDMCAWLRDVPKGHPVIIRGQKEAEFPVAMLACMICELPYVPLDRVFPPDRVEKIQGILGSQVLIQCGERENFNFAREINARTGEVMNKGSASFQTIASVAGDPLVYVIFTSGSTGEPKGVEITRSNVHDLLHWVIGPDFRFEADDVFINQCSFSFDVSFFDLLASLHTGATLTLNSPDQIKNPDEFTKYLAPLDPSVWVSTPSFLSLALLNRDFNAQVLPRLKRFYVAGEIVHHSLAKRLLEKFPDGHLLNAYGPTEATVILTLVDVTEELMKKYPTVPIGYIKENTTVELFDTFQQDGETVGEIVIVGENIARGYYGRPDLTAQKFLKVGGRKAYRTGDHGFYKDGLLFFIGRIDNQIKLHGFRIELDEIDSHIMNVPSVELSVTVPLVRDGDVKKLVAFAKLKEKITDEDAIAQIKAHLEKKVPYYMVPSAFKIVPDFPYGASYKIDKKKLLELL